MEIKNYTLTEVAEMLNMSLKQVKKFVSSGELKTTKEPVTQQDFDVTFM